MSNSNIEYKACSDYIANACVCVDTCNHKEHLNNEKQKPNYVSARKVPVIDPSTIAKENTISPSVFHDAINVYNNNQELKDFQNQKVVKDDNKLKLSGILPFRKQIFKFVCLDNIKELKLIKGDYSKMGSIAPVKSVVGIETPAQVNAAAQNVNNNSDITEIHSTPILKKKNIKVPEIVNLEENDQLENLLNTIDGVSEFKSVKTENYIIDAFCDEGFSCFQDQIQENVDNLQFSNDTNNIQLSHEPLVENCELLKENIKESFMVNGERLDTVSNAAENSFNSVIKEGRDQISHDDPFNTAHYVRRSSRKRKQIDVLDTEGSDDEMWQSKRKSKGKEKPRRKCDYDSMEYLPGRSYGRMSKNQAVNPKRSYRYYGSNNFTYTADPNCFSNYNSTLSTSSIFTNPCCKVCILNKWNEAMMKDLLQADVATKQKLLHNLRQRLLGNIPGYTRPEGWLSQIFNQYPAP